MASHNTSTTVSALWSARISPVVASSAYLGGALLVGSWWSLALLPLVMFAVARLAIQPEEQYLNAQFGETYADYRARVRRWL